MADQETLAALKRAYADTILNTTKEAAARVMISEKKARSYQQELVTVRDEALHTLLRLKQMLDSKVKETEIISMKQQQKVEELEAQLEEAEDIVGELRSELRELQDELIKLTNGQTHLESDHEKDVCSKNRDAAVSVVPEVSCSHQTTCIPVEQSGSVVANGIKLPSLTNIISINRCSYNNNKGQCHYTLPSILKKRRDSEGCTKIIRRVDSSLANGDLSSSMNDEGCLHKASFCKSVETLETSGCADATNSICSVRDEEALIVSPNAPQKNVGTSLSVKTSPPREDENDRKLSNGETDARKEEKESSEHIDMDILASPLCEETPVLALSKNRCIKYTFKRKRKRDSSTNLEGDNRNMKQKTEEKEEGYLKSLKPSFTSESSGDIVYT